MIVRIFANKRNFSNCFVNTDSQKYSKYVFIWCGIHFIDNFCDTIDSGIISEGEFQHGNVIISTKHRWITSVDYHTMYLAYFRPSQNLLCGIVQ